MKPILIASDHAGFDLKRRLIDHLRGRDVAVADLGTHSDASVDYPAFATRMAEALAAGEGDRGVLVCGTGIGIAMAANRHPHVRAAVCHDVSSTRLARRHNDANVLALGARLIGDVAALDCVDAFLETAFEGGRHARRVDQMARLPDRPQQTDSNSR